jgi:hypothetical protein
MSVASFLNGSKTQLSENMLAMISRWRKQIARFRKREFYAEYITQMSHQVNVNM